MADPDPDAGIETAFLREPPAEPETAADAQPVPLEPIQPDLAIAPLVDAELA
jgi:hypothetical protein